MSHLLFATASIQQILPTTNFNYSKIKCTFFFPDASVKWSDWWIDAGPQCFVSSNTHGSSTQSNLSSVSVIILGTAMQKWRAAQFSPHWSCWLLQSLFFFFSFFGFFWGPAVHLGTVQPVINELVHKKYYTFSHTATSFLNNSSPHANQNENVSCKTEALQRCCCFFFAKHASSWSWLILIWLPSYAAAFQHVYTKWDCDIVTPWGPGLKPGQCTFLFPPKSDWAQGLYLLNASYILGAITPQVRLGLKIEPAHRQTLGVNDISISEEQDAAFETAALWQKPHILEF